MKLNYILFMFCVLFSYQGELVSYELIESFTANQVQDNLYNDLGNAAPDVLYDVSMYKILYKTIDPYGNEVIASGVIGFPENKDQAFPFMSWQHGTEVKRDNVSSIRGFNALSFWITGRGYIYLEPDYLGLGESEILHPYCLKNPSAWTTIDLIRAAKTFTYLSNEIESNNDVILFGYSEGGYVTMATHFLIEENEIDEFNFIASFPMAGPYDLSGTMVDLMLMFEPYGEPFYLPYVLVPYITYYEMGSLYDYFLPEYAQQFEYLFNGNYSASDINSIMPEIPIEVLLPSVISDFTNNLNHPLRINLSENDLYNWAPQIDMHMYHGIGDELIPYQNSQIAYDTFINNGSENINLYLAPEEFGGHSSVAQYCLISAYEICEENYKNIRNIGDINGDGLINVSDVVSMVYLIVSIIEINGFDLWVSDLDYNESVNIQDVILIINQILSR